MLNQQNARYLTQLPALGTRVTFISGDQALMDAHRIHTGDTGTVVGHTELAGHHFAVAVNFGGVRPVVCLLAELAEVA